MGSFIARRLVGALISVWGVVTLVFLILRIVPGDPALYILGDFARPEAIVELRKHLGLEGSILSQYARFVSAAARGDLGSSLVSKQPVLAETLKVFPHTVVLTGAGLLAGVAIGVPSGVLAALRRNTVADALIIGMAVIGASVPSFWVGIVLLLILAHRLALFPVITVAEAGAGEALAALVLPGLTLGLALGAALARITRSSVLEVLSQDYVRTAHAKGLQASVVIWRHVMRNAAIPIVTLLGINVGRLLGGAVVVEVVFTRPGVGRLLVGSILARDYTQVQGAIVLFALVFVLLNLGVDLLYGLLNPRVRYG